MFQLIQPDFVREAHAVLTVYLTTFLGGYSMGFSAVAIPDIKSEMKSKDQSNLISTIQASSEELSWFGEDLFHNVDIMKIMHYAASILLIGQFFGAIVGGYLGGKYGPKKAVQMCCLFGIPGWVLIAVAPNFPLLIVGRILCGFGHTIGTANSSLLVAQYRYVTYHEHFKSFFLALL